MRSTLIGIFDDRHAAERAREELLRAGFADDEVDLRTGTEDRAWRDADERRLAQDRGAYDDETETSIGETVSDWFRSLFGIDDDADVGIYTEAVRRGESVVTVNTANEDRIDRASDILEACGSVDIDEQANGWQLQGWARPSGATDTSSASSTSSSAPLGATAASAAAMGAASRRDAGDRAGETAHPAATATETGTSTGTGIGRGTTHPESHAAAASGAASGASSEELRAGESRKIPVIEEHLRVGKRIVGRRRLRVYTRMVDEPVEENVRLTDEHVHVERHDADRPATEADFRAAQGKSIDVTERSEEPVVAKQARVVGEVEIGKEKREREETVRETVRHTDVDVQKLDEAGRTAGASTKPTDADRRPANGSDTTSAGDTHRPGDAPTPPDVRR